MPSRIDDLMAGANGRFFDAFAEKDLAVEYQAYNGVTWRAVNAILPPEYRLPDMDQRVRNFYNTVECWIDSTNDVTGVLVPHELRNGADWDSIRVGGAGGVTYKIQRVLARNQGGMHHLLLHDCGVAS